MESICDDEKTLEANILLKIEHSPDYKGMDKAHAYKDLRQRIKHYEKVSSDQSLAQ